MLVIKSRMGGYKGKVRIMEIVEKICSECYKFGRCKGDNFKVRRKRVTIQKIESIIPEMHLIIWGLECRIRETLSKDKTKIIISEVRIE